MAQEDRNPTANSEKLSQWAEQTLGLVGKDLYVVNEGGELVLKEEPEYANRCIIKVHTSATYAKRKWPTRPVSIGGPTETVKRGDALFWSEAAAEKFVWPYYHSQRLFNSEVRKYHRAFKENSKIVALLHTYPSHLIPEMRDQLVPLGLDETEGGLTVVQWD